MYDLPQALHDSIANESSMEPAAGNKPLSNSGAIGHMTPLLSASHTVSTPVITDDWTFLRDFGDSTDQFYDWDTELRNLLNSNLPNDLNEYSFT